MTEVTGVRPIVEMVGEDAEETAQFNSMLAGARKYLLSQKWCSGIRDVQWGTGVGGLIAVFLFRIEAAPKVDDVLWVICGDLPSAYLVTDVVRDPVGAALSYCDLMDDWASAVESGGDLKEVFPVEAAPIKEHADMLRLRTSFLRKEIIPVLREWQEAEEAAIRPT